MSYLVRGQFVLTMNDRVGADGIVEGGAVYVSGKNIAEVGRYNDLKAIYPTATVIGSSRFWVTPGFVNAHQHGKGLTTFQLGGLDDCFEISRFSPEPQATVEPYIDTLYGCMRMIEAGITTCIHYNSSRGPSFYETDVLDRIRAYQDSGIRVSFGLDIRDRNHLVYGDEEFIQSLPSALKEKIIEKYTRSRTLTADAYFPFVKKLSDLLAGALEPGKQADLVLLDSRDFALPYLAPQHNPIDTLVYRGRSSAVDTGDGRRRNPLPRKKAQTYR